MAQVDKGFEGHGESSSPPSMSKGEFIQSGETFAPLAEKATSVNQKSGNVGDGQTK